MTADVAAVVIGRNEGARLLRCLEALESQVAQVIYVDSGSTDDSLAEARARGATVVELDLSRPFTAARARNAGLTRLADAPHIAYVHFIDGDCEIQPGWVAQAHAFLEDNPQVAVVAGRRRERFPDATLWNRLADEEWASGALGQVKSCGGDALMRLEALHEVEGYTPTLIAGEEPELCVRLRAKGWQVWRLDAEMTLHDADMTRLGQWWQRCRRAGYTYAEGAALHGRPPERHNVARLRRTLLWGGVLPLAVLLGFLITPWALLGLLIWPAQIARQTAKGLSPASAAIQSLMKLAEMQGVLTYLWRRLQRGPATLIEYK